MQSGPKLRSRRTGRTYRILVSLAASICLAGCARSDIPVGAYQPVAMAEATQPSQPELPTYRIGALDVLSLKIFQEPDFDLEKLPVDEDGTVFVPLVGRIMAAGMTTSELSAELADRLDEKFLVNPQVAIELEESYSYRVTVEGEVEEPGIFPVRGQMSLLQSVALAGGASEDASLTNVYVMRNIDNQKMIARFDLRDVRTGKMMDPALLPGDTVVVGLASARRVWRELLTVLPSLAGIFIAVEQSN